MNKIYYKSLLSLAATFILLGTGCSDKGTHSKRQHQKPIISNVSDGASQKAMSEAGLETEEMKFGDLMITFSTTNDLMTAYPSFKLGLYDIVAYIRTPTNLHSVSLYDIEPVATTGYANTVAVELSHLKKNHYLYHGFFKVPAGKLESVQLQVVGKQSNITIGHETPILIDAFFATYTAGDSRLPTRVFPAFAITKVNQNITISENKLALVNIEVDMNLTAGMEPVRHSEPERAYALFTPSITVEEVVGSLDIAINQVDLISFTHSTLGFGDPDGTLFTANYMKAMDAKFFVNGEETQVLEGINGLYAIDMVGTLTGSASDTSFLIKYASLMSFSADSNAAIYKGYVDVDEDVLSIKGTKQNLSMDEMSAGPSSFNSRLGGVSAAGLGLSDGEIASIWFDGTTAKLMNRRTAEPISIKRVFDLRSTVSYTPADILSFNTLSSTDTHYSLALAEQLTCEHYVKNLATGITDACSEKLTSIEFSKSSVGKYTLHETRKGTLEDSADNTLDNFFHETDYIQHFDTAEAFIAELESRIKMDKYRLAVFTAEGTVEGAAFKVGSVAKAIILQPNEAMDSAADTWVAKVRLDSSGSLATDKNIGLYAGVSVAGLLGLAAVAALGNFVLRRKQSFISKIPLQIRELAMSSYGRGIEITVDKINIKGTTVEYEGKDNNKIYFSFKDKNGNPVKVQKGVDGSIERIIEPTQGDSKEVLTRKIVDKFGRVNDDTVYIDKMYSQRPLLGSNPILVDQEGKRFSLAVATASSLPALKETTSEIDIKPQAVETDVHVKVVNEGFEYEVFDPEKRKLIRFILKHNGEINVIGDKSDSQRVLFALIDPDDPNALKKRLSKLRAGTTAGVSLLLIAVAVGGSLGSVAIAGAAAVPTVTAVAAASKVFGWTVIASAAAGAGAAAGAIATAGAIGVGVTKTTTNEKNFATSNSLDRFRRFYKSALPEGFKRQDEFNKSNKMKVFFEVDANKMSLRSLLANNVYLDDMPMLRVRSSFDPMTGKTGLKINNQAIEINRINFTRKKWDKKESVDLSDPINGTLELNEGELVLTRTLISFSEHEDFVDVGLSPQERIVIAKFNEKTGKFSLGEDIENFDVLLESSSQKLGVESKLITEYARFNQEKKVKKDILNNKKQPIFKKSLITSGVVSSSDATRMGIIDKIKLTKSKISSHIFSRTKKTK